MEDAATIRRASAHDAAAFRQIENSAGMLFNAIPHLAWLTGIDDLPVDLYREIVAYGWSWCAVDPAGRCIGFVCCTPEGSDFHVWELAVQRERQGRGIGRTLMETSIAAARQGGFRVVTLTTFRDVPWNAPFYRRLGFQILEPDKVSQRLHGVVAEESLRGLPAEYRCVMRLNLEPAPD